MTVFGRIDNFWFDAKRHSLTPLHTLPNLYQKKTERARKKA
ncbi:hypothetical protein C789_2424 [Microcystis aeruginosa FACHB-905 = DIANCHI905]|nr:hypothetical protein C789_2424 [Microcystis aeruginosa FACHB-905 = DIANCHI905]